MSKTNEWNLLKSQFDELARDDSELTASNSMLTFTAGSQN